ncbi:hypothetical protein SPRG_04905 [Saprolegnia parasitica CBS 223.65]|uniref:Uncharacterized protein n=1 Tax=Saprolegnia parasitica (strain CBS 223.65) TaxID=695850 RepID=A0A067CKS8_SAPPC|nr:hypothetical protein SPRG_04905 [Saprolegnia parasitica CBS 223.65]KDO29790.1 hypothetical protein SPRG_04905 [Saprolegnia parasitica CBS 223.65]|eukprot:XP_012199435.1 hypothetical protein SPRG_04905 [Saprolegnia parasitica CBS 223.65]
MDALLDARPKPKGVTLCPRCRGFPKESSCAFYNTKTRESLDFPPWGTAAICSTVFHHHGTTQFVCRCRDTALTPVMDRAKTSQSKRARYHSVV